jgi:glycosyltransferase involved in cell wall biosynthesis
MINSTTTLGFILKGYPRVSETFIAQEIYLLEQLGFKIEILSMRKAREPERQPIVAMIKAPVTYIPEYIFSKDFGSILGAQFRTFANFPGGYLKKLVEAGFKSLTSRDDSPIKRFLQASWLIAYKGLGKSSPIGHFHSHFAHSPTELAYYLSGITGLRYSISAHAKDIYTIPSSELQARINASQLIMTCTEYNYNFMRALPQVHKDKINQVYHGINLENFKPNALLQDGDVIPQASLSRFFSVGRLVPKKGYGDIFLALQMLKNKGFSFSYDIYGAGELKKELHQLRAKLGLEKEIIFHDVTTHPEIIKRMQNKGIFICGSRLGEDGDRDGIPNTLAEAMAMELPVIATNVSGIPELVENSVSGLLVEEKSPEALARGLEFLLTNPEKSTAMGRNARIRVAQVFNCNNWIQQCARLLTPFATPKKSTEAAL